MKTIIKFTRYQITKDNTNGVRQEQYKDKTVHKKIRDSEDVTTQLILEMKV